MLSKIQGTDTSTSSRGEERDAHQAASTGAHAHIIEALI